MQGSQERTGSTQWGSTSSPLRRCQPSGQGCHPRGGCGRGSVREKGQGAGKAWAEAAVAACTPAFAQKACGTRRVRPPGPGLRALVPAPSLVHSMSRGCSTGAAWVDVRCAGLPARELHMQSVLSLTPAPDAAGVQNGLQCRPDTGHSPTAFTVTRHNA